VTAPEAKAGGRPDPASGDPSWLPPVLREPPAGRLHHRSPARVRPGTLDHGQRLPHRSAALGRDARPDVRVEGHAIVLAEMANGVHVSLDPSFSRTELPTLLPAALQVAQGGRGVAGALQDQGTLLVDTFGPGIYLQPDREGTMSGDPPCTTAGPG